MKYTLEFEAPADWKPMRDAICWTKCPLAILTPLAKPCRAREIYEKNGGIFCPIIKLTVKEQK